MNLFDAIVTRDIKMCLFKWKIREEELIIVEKVVTNFYLAILLSIKFMTGSLLSKYCFDDRETG